MDGREGDSAVGWESLSLGSYGEDWRVSIENAITIVFIHYLLNC